jgi:elongation of very long chain fatty acids protein 6
VRAPTRALARERERRPDATADTRSRLRGSKEIFDGYWWCNWTANHWVIPLSATVCYLLMIAFLKKYMATREKMRLQPVVIVWNFGLSFFSMAGVYYCAPHLLFNARSGLFTQGFYPSVCSEPASYGYGMEGFFVFLFIYSKLAELVDTLWLLLRKSPVILLHWYHHVTVLLYCWHSYSVRIGTGLWFASMNYTVHSIMYFYFGLTQCGPAGRKFAKNFAMLITSMQLLQMVVGIIVRRACVAHASRTRRAASQRCVAHELARARTHTRPTRHVHRRHATRATPRHAAPRRRAAPRRATPRHATPRHATPRHATRHVCATRHVRRADARCCRGAAGDGVVGRVPRKRRDVLRVIGQLGVRAGDVRVLLCSLPTALPQPLRLR